MRAAHQSHLAERMAAMLAALLILGLVGFLLVRNEPLASDQLFFALRVILSLAAGVLGGTLPGFLNLGWTGRGLSIRAGGALALFVLTFMYTPDLTGQASMISAPGGVAGGYIRDSTITIENRGAAPPAPQ